MLLGLCTDRGKEGGQQYKFIVTPQSEQSLLGSTHRCEIEGSHREPLRRLIHCLTESVTVQSMNVKSEVLVGLVSYINKTRVIDKGHLEAMSSF